MCRSFEVTSVAKAVKSSSLSFQQMLASVVFLSLLVSALADVCERADELPQPCTSTAPELEELEVSALQCCEEVAPADLSAAPTLRLRSASAVCLSASSLRIFLFIIVHHFLGRFPSSSHSC